MILQRECRSTNMEHRECTNHAGRRATDDESCSTDGTVGLAQPPKMKMTTDIPASITAPDKVETSIGTLEYFDGVPTDEDGRDRL